MDKLTLLKLLNSKMKEFDLLFQEVLEFKHRLAKNVYFPEFGHCSNVVQMNRLLKARKEEIDAISSQI